MKKKRMLTDREQFPGYQLRCSVGTVYGEHYYVVAPISAFDKWDSMIKWTIEAFGPSAKDGVQTPGHRWYTNNAKFWFKYELDQTTFVLKWA